MLEHHQRAPGPGQAAWPQDWRLLAACRFEDPELFFPMSVSGRGAEQAATAKVVCAACEARPECLAFALRTGQSHGIWGGMTEQERVGMGAAFSTPGTEVLDLGRMSPAVRESVQRASGLPARPGWERKATAHAEIFRLLADPTGTAGEPDLAGLMRDLMLTVGPVADGMIISSRQRLLAHLCAGDDDSAAVEMRDHLRVLHYMGRLARRPDAGSAQPGQPLDAKPFHA